MTTLLKVFIVVSGTILLCSCKNPRAKRSFVQFGMMILKLTKRNPLRYNGYGCWCGIGGKGTPKDEVDRCCRTHDLCYIALGKNLGCDNRMFNSYSYTLSKGIKCRKNKNNACEQGICKCDREAAYCFDRHTYNNKYRDWNGGC